MGNEFIADPLNHVKPGDIVTVRVISVDAERKRVGFSMKSDTPMVAKATEKAPANKAKKYQPISGWYGEKTRRPYRARR